MLPHAGDFQFANNIVYATHRNFRRFPCGQRCAHNLFWRMPPSGLSAIGANPRFLGREAGSLLIRRPPGVPARLALAAAFRLRPGSPARRAGMPIPGDPGGVRDYFGRAVTDPPSIGFDQPPT